MSVQLAVFDMAGTTVQDNNNVADAFLHAFALHGIPVDTTMVTPLMGYHKPQAIQMVLEKQAVDFDSVLIGDIHHEFEERMIAFYDSDRSVQPIPGTEEVFLQLKEKGICIVLNTGFSHEVAASIIARFRWFDRGLIDGFIGSDEVERGRPYPDMIYKLMDRNGIRDPQLVAKIGDTTVDVEEGLNAGCGYVIAVTTGASTATALLAKNPTHLIHRLAELQTILF